MKLLSVGFLFWLFAAVIVARLVRIGARSCPPTSRPVLLWCFSLAAAVLLLFRPHQDFFGGQDQGAYANVAVSYARHGKLSYTDPLLSKVPSETRPSFFYGDETFPDTKDMCFWVKDIDSARIGTWFQPAFPVLMSVAAAPGPDTWVLYVTPLFTILTAVALWALAGLLIDRPWSGAAAFVLYLVNPVTIWHGRGVRAEAAASFFLFAGCALMVQAWIEKKRPARIDILAGSLCLALAPFFHVSAWLAVIPAAAVLTLVTLCGQTAFVAGPVAAFAGLVAFLAQTRFITDSYELGRLAGLIFENPFAWSCGAVGLLLALGFCSTFLRTRRARATAVSATKYDRIVFVASMALASITSVILIMAYANVLPGPNEKYAVWALRLVGTTRINAFVTAVTRPLALAGLAGWIVFILRRDDRRLARMALALTLFPAIILVGEMPILMYFLRRTFAVIAPVFALGLAALVGLLPRGRSARLSICRLAAIIALALPGIGRRTLLYTTTDYKGFPAFLRQFADAVRESDGILLCEYSRIAAPFEHLFGIPTLGLDNESHFEYGSALDAWAEIMEGEPDRPAFFITPFGLPIDSRFTFTPVLRSRHRMRFLRSASGRLPVTIREPLLNLAMYRMHRVAGPEAPRQVFESPYVRAFDETNMGLRNFHAGRKRRWEMTFLRLDPEVAYGLEPVGGSLPTVEHSDLECVLLCRCASTNPPAPDLTMEGVTLGSHAWGHLADNWWIYRARASEAGPRCDFEVHSSTNMLLAAAMLVGESGITRLASSSPNVVTETTEMFARWAGADARVAVPLPPDGQGLVLLLVNPCHPDEHKRLQLRVSNAENPSSGHTMPMAVEGWQWLACRLPDSENNPLVQWLNLSIRPPWNPGRYGYPRDLGVQIKYLAILPDLKRDNK